jgi:N4-gp56 family major capsid protein
MATTTYSASDDRVQKLWSKKVQTEALISSDFGRFCDTSDSALGVIYEETSKDAGDQVRFPLVNLLEGDGTTENETLEGNEEAISSHYDTLVINKLRHATRAEVTITDQRIPWDLGAQHARLLTLWWKDRFDTIAANHLCGYNLEARTKYVGFNSVNTPSSGRIIRATGSDDDSLGSGNVFTLSLIDQARELATTGGSTGLPPIRPIKAAMTGGGTKDMYVCFLHSAQVTSVRTAASANVWRDIQLNLLAGGYDKSNPIFGRALGVYGDTVLIESRYMRGGITNAGAAKANTRRAVFCGAHALSLAFGKGFSKDSGKVRDETFDYGDQYAKSLTNVFGLKATRFNSSDYGKIVISTFAADAA